MLTDVEEYRPNRNWIRLGDKVRCSPVVGGKFRATVTRIRADEDGVIVEVEVYGGKANHEKVRTFPPERIARLAQSRVVSREE
jgi:hypothetical protein